MVLCAVQIGKDITGVPFEIEFIWYHTFGFMFPIIVACFWNVVINFLLTQFLFCRESTTACWEHIISSNFFCKHKIFEWLKSLDCSLLPSAYDIHSVVDSVTNNEFIFQTQTLRHSYVYAFPDCSTLTQAEPAANMA